MHTMKIEIDDLPKKRPGTIQRRSVRVDGVRMDNLTVCWEMRLREMPRVIILDQRVLYPTEVWVNGTLVVRDQGLLPQPHKVED
jgi:hypothetical protein